MKTQIRNKSGGSLVALLALMVFILAPPKLFSCDYCNNAFTEELLNGKRKNSLIAQETRLAMANQQPATPAKPAAEEKKEFIEIINRDNRLPIPATGYVPQNTTPTKRVSIDLAEGFAYLGQG